ncbi:uncharacterized protein DNG_01826 [Cephalotrichum gorgonifer]|uniref:Uncharacterized protein n=1 Tax=Cephalotrichum gorgonifer TaxID=2041049 RepID=A0AAE8SRZ7_9PEZI|nr:uncharacterized protein DNG_01826 [Cephalotrichum gorgonifer]
MDPACPCRQVSCDLGGPIPRLLRDRMAIDPGLVTARDLRGLISWSKDGVKELMGPLTSPHKAFGIKHANPAEPLGATIASIIEDMVRVLYPPLPACPRCTKDAGAEAISHPMTPFPRLLRERMIADPGLVTTYGLQEAMLWAVYSLAEIQDEDDGDRDKSGYDEEYWNWEGYDVYLGNENGGKEDDDYYKDSYEHEYDDDYGHDGVDEEAVPFGGGWAGNIGERYVGQRQW